MFMAYMFKNFKCFLLGDVALVHLKFIILTFSKFGHPCLIVFFFFN